MLAKIQTIVCTVIYPLVGWSICWHCSKSSALCRTKVNIRCINPSFYLDPSVILRIYSSLSQIQSTRIPSTSVVLICSYSFIFGYHHPSKHDPADIIYQLRFCEWLSVVVLLATGLTPQFLDQTPLNIFYIQLPFVIVFGWMVNSCWAISALRSQK